MKFFMKELVENGISEIAHDYFLRFGKGNYKRRFLMSFNKSKKVKIKSSFELANDFVKFIRENKDVKFSGKILMKDKIEGLESKKKGGVFVYEVSESNLEKFENAYFYLLNVNSDDLVLKIKGSIPKPGKNANKIDDGFCTMSLDLEFWEEIKKLFFWDVPDCKKAFIEHEIVVTEIVLPEGEDDPVKIRKMAKRKGKIIRKMICDGNEKVKEFNFVA